MTRITMKQQNYASDCFEKFLASCMSKGLANKTIKTYQNHMNAMTHYLSFDKDISQIKQKDLDEMIVAMRKANLSSNSISSYLRTLKVFFNWCNQNGYSSIAVKSYKTEETVKETYTDGELAALLKKPDIKKCSFAEYRNWVIINFLVNGGCRTQTILNIQIRDVDFDNNIVHFRHNKNRKVQVIPLCTTMQLILKEYLTYRGGEPEDYLFCTVTGEKFAEESLRSAIRLYNAKRGVTKNSIHAFRHTFAKKYLLECNGNAFTLQKLLGHSTLDTTKKYCAIFDVELSKNFDEHSPLTMFTQKEERIKMEKQKRK